MREIREVAEALERAAAAGVETGVGEVWRARVRALATAPDGAGWEWLAARGDGGAQAVLEYARGAP